MIEVEDLGKQYGDLTAVGGVSFSAPEGAIFGLLGPNGAGKSTTIGCISGLLTPTSGRVRVLGHDVVTAPRRAKESLGVVPQDLALYDELDARANLGFWGAAYGLRGAELKSRVDEVLVAIGLLDRAREPVKKYSGGMKRRLNLGCALVHRPRVLLLDEPTVGVDPQSRVRLLELIRQEVARGCCVLYTTHYMEEAEELCDRVAIIDHGEIIAAGTLPELRGILGERDVLRLRGEFAGDAARSAVEAVAGVEVVQCDEGGMRLAVPDGARTLPEVVGALSSVGARVDETTLTRASLESLFIKLTGKELRE